MGCYTESNSSLPVLLCQFEKGKEAQKEYCFSLKNNINYHKPITFIIKSDKTSKFSINVEINGKLHNIRYKFDKYDEDNLEEDLRKLYTLLNEHYSRYD